MNLVFQKKLTTWILLGLCFVSTLNAGIGETVTIITESEISSPVSFGIEELSKALQSRDLITIKSVSRPEKQQETTILTGLADRAPEIRKALYQNGVTLPTSPEALLIKRSKDPHNKELIVTGADEQGAMYALLELAEQVRSMPEGADIVTSVKEVQETPYTHERSLMTYIRGPHIQEGYWHDPNYWEILFSQLAYSRINSYNLTFKYKAPIYTLFFDVEGWPADQTNGIVVSAEEQKRNLAALQRIVQQAHDHGVKITLGIWDHVSNPDDAERLAGYTQLAIAKLTRLVPLDAFQFRMHWESGLPRDPDALEEFWGSVFDGINNSGRNIRIYPRAKGLPDRVIQLALEKGMDIAIETKYTAEQMGMPFHPAHIQRGNQFDRRHGYADLLTYPKRYDMLWRMWSGGSQKLLTWGDLNYARRWVRSTKLYDSGIFEIMEIEGAEPMGDGSQRCLNDEYVYTDYEFQRYWCHKLMFGRIGYNPDTPDWVFQREFIQRFGPEAGPVIMEAMSHAGMVIPRIISSALPNFAENRGVPEWGSGTPIYGKARLSAYAEVKPCDIQTFIGFQEAARLLIEGFESGRIWPQQTSDWFARTADEIFKLAERAEMLVGIHRNKEFEAVLTDLRILAGMARFHSIRFKAAVYYNLYLELNKNREALENAIDYEKQAVEAYRQVVDIVGDMYRTDLDLSSSDTGHWQDELKLLEAAFIELQHLPRNDNVPVPSITLGTEEDQQAPTVMHRPVTRAEIGKPITLQARITDPSGVKWARVRYRGVTQFQDYQTQEMTAQGDLYTAVIPAEEVHRVTEYDTETGALWNFMYLIEVIDNKGNGRIVPDMAITDPYVFVSLPHKTLEETGGKFKTSRIRDKTYDSTSVDAPQFEIITPRDGSIFLPGSDIIIKLKHPWVDPNERIRIYVNSKPAEAEILGDLEYVIRRIDSGRYRIKGVKEGHFRINAYLSSTDKWIWSNTVEIVIDQQNRDSNQ